jgi:hypothetical protein
MRHKAKLPPQVVRIVLLAAAIVGSYVVARAMLTPGSWKQYGFYRGAALTELASREPVYAGKSACAECHEAEVQNLAAHEHKTLSCEGCHGAGQAHADDPDHVDMTVLSAEDCLRCHEKNTSRPQWQKQVSVTDHYSPECKECHVPHMPKEVP